MSTRRTIRTASLIAALSCIPACQLDVVLVGQQTDEGTPDAAVDSVADVGTDDVREPGDELEAGDDVADAAEAEATDGGSGDVTVDGEDVAPPPCPVFAAVAPAAGPPNGSRERPYAGLQAAVDARGGCEQVVLLPDAAGAPFDARVDIVLTAGGTLLIEGDPAAGARVELDAGGERGLFVTGDGTLELRWLAVRLGTNTLAGGDAGGGCLHADVATLLVDDMAWTECASARSGGAIWVRAGRIEIRRSDFFRNAAEFGSGGALAIHGSAETAVVVDGCRFLENGPAESGGAIDLAAPTIDSLIAASWFVRNRARVGGAISGYLGGAIKGNRFEANAADEGPGALAGNGGWFLAEILRNVFVENVGGTSSGSGRAGAIELESPFLTVRNNLFVRNRGAEVEAGAVDLAFGNPRVINNTFVDNDNGDRAEAHLHVMDGEMRSNIFVGGSGEHSWCATAYDVAEPPRGYNATWLPPAPGYCREEDAGHPGNIEADPRFLDPGSGDYRLGPDSPCIDAGVPEDAFRDADGSPNDMGAFGGPLGDWTPLPADGGP
ncbi:MAG: right-handed parallel beta-helix repeat-containing protein [Deltaproteobacteria bacterium]|nr:right-handed parallel beta-helix repeat-containing protein [Deltaproteobacteria bacterium]